MADRRPCKHVNDFPNDKLINILTEKHLKRGSSRVRCSYQCKNMCKNLFLRVNERPHIKDTNNGMMTECRWVIIWPLKFSGGSIPYPTTVEDKNRFPQQSKKFA